MQLISMESLFIVNMRSLFPLSEFFYGVVVIFTRDQEFGYILCIKDAISLPFTCISIIQENQIDMELAKALMVSHIISDACIKEDDHVVDVLTLGYAAKKSLLLQ